MKGFFFKYVISIALGTLLIWLAFYNEDWSGFGDRLRAIEPWGALIYLFLFAVSHVIRIQRWGVLVRALGPVSWKSIFSSGSVGYMCISVFPLRLGEFVRPYLVRGEGGVTASGALATVVVERVIDGLLFVALFFAFISILPPSGNPLVSAVRWSGYAAGAVFVIALIVLIAAERHRDKTLQLLEKIGNKIHKGLTAKALKLLDSFLDGLKVLPDKRRLGGFMVLTLIYWVIQGASIKFMADACHIPDLTWSGSFALLTILVVGIMVPAGPGFTGTFELSVKASFALLLISEQSLANVTLFTIMLHLSQLAVQVAFGAVYLFTGQVRLSQVIEAQEHSAEEA